MPRRWMLTLSMAIDLSVGPAPGRTDPRSRRSLGCSSIDRRSASQPPDRTRRPEVRAVAAFLRELVELVLPGHSSFQRREQHFSGRKTTGSRSRGRRSLAEPHRRWPSSPHTPLETRYPAMAGVPEMSSTSAIKSLIADASSTMSPVAAKLGSPRSGATQLLIGTN